MSCVGETSSSDTKESKKIDPCTGAATLSTEASRTKRKAAEATKKRKLQSMRNAGWDKEKKMTVDELAMREDGTIPNDWLSHIQPLCRWVPEGQRSLPTCFRVSRHKENSNFCSQHCPDYLRSQQDKISKLLKSVDFTAIKDDVDSGDEGERGDEKPQFEDSQQTSKVDCRVRLSTTM